MSSERLAAIADDEPTAAEAMHLAGCARCASERRAQQELLASSRALRTDLQKPLTHWSTLSARLSNEGLIVARPARPARTSPRVATSRIWRRFGALAAAVVLMAVGAGMGRYSAGAPILSSVAAPAAANAAGESITFASNAEALDVFLRAQREYQAAAAYMAASGSSGDASREAILTRLAALEEMAAPLVAALREAPTDPVLNEYYISTLGAAEATRQQLSSVIPVGMQVRRY